MPGQSHSDCTASSRVICISNRQAGGQKWLVWVVDNRDLFDEIVHSFYTSQFGAY